MIRLIGLRSLSLGAAPGPLLEFTLRSTLSGAVSALRAQRARNAEAFTSVRHPQADATTAAAGQLEIRALFPGMLERDCVAFEQRPEAVEALATAALEGIRCGCAGLTYDNSLLRRYVKLNRHSHSAASLQLVTSYCFERERITCHGGAC